MTISNRTPLLDTIKTPEDLRKLEPDQLQQVADEVAAAAATEVNGGVEVDLRSPWETFKIDARGISKLCIIK